MTTADARIRQIESKIERAESHILDLQRGVHSFLESHPYRVGIKRNPQTLQLIYYLVDVRPTPEVFSLMAGDAIQNLMSALDHLAYQLICTDTGDRPPSPGRIYFPIADTRDKYESTKRGKIQGASAETIGAIDALKPYKGGNDLLWMLQRLNNVDKHRLLITVGSRLRSLNLGAVVSKYINTLRADPANPFHGEEMPVLDLWFGESPSVCPLKVGEEVYIDAANAEPNENLQFRFDVALNEPEIVESQSLLETLHQLATLVRGILSAFTPTLRTAR